MAQPPLRTDPPPSTARGRVRRARLLQVACEHFLANGYDGTSMDAVVAAAGGSKATLYRNFGDKQTLFAACIAHLCDEFLARLATLDIEHPGFDDALRAILLELVDVVGSPRHVEFYRLVVAGAGVPGVGEAWYRHGPQVWHRLLTRLLDRHARATGDTPATIPHGTLAELLFDSLLAHLTIETVILGHAIDRDRVAARIEAIVTAARQLVAPKA
ncbi:TetR/AcrR family transcriptional regulator [Luteimonas sp. BDR2-5]|uniref:TetR/AcrR family transcriptional regulator n=1 Tax=Proluteimonas luteida TaxID=2878685 RepID=UPI001E3DABC2|nr:TetR/AcrR family transcriptional regulator [Luteimonas sp. BDR2-5]MCD9029130.1 TetR/AcrR family transcriptional regulator [Luteimonas sp. BDR2-5]